MQNPGISVRVRVGMALAGLVACWACSDTRPPGPTPCSSDANCPDGQICHAGACRTQCLLSSDCPAGDLCVSGVCLHPCTSDQDCPPAERCSAGYCTPRGDGPDAGTDGDGGGPVCVDEDGDGYGVNCARGPDCDDTDPAAHPGSFEACADGKDNDCDGLTDEADCGCLPGTQHPCYTGPAGTVGRGICRNGVAICQPDRTLGTCLGERVPGTEECNGVDEDCDGQTDEDLLNDCGECGPLAPELCGDSLDNDCDGQIDEDCDCDPGCHCEEGSSGVDCECHPPTDQPCYSGPPATGGRGICRGGTHDCVALPAGGYAWNECQGEVLPGTECQAGQADALDNDCDGLTDEDCLPDRDGDGFSPPEDCDDADDQVSPLAPEVCDGRDQNCNGVVDDGVTNACGTCGPVPDEVCADGLDNDCDGAVDEGCGGCAGSEQRPCYRGPDGTQGTGQCQAGSMTCDGEFWSACQGDVLPDPEVCDGADNDCDGLTDEPWAIGSNACGFCDDTELCDGQDNDCDGLTDEGVTNACGQCDPPVVPPESLCDGADNDCDGLTDEGLLNGCGTCGESCFTGEWGGQDDWPKGESDGVSNDENPDELQLDSSQQSPHYIWIAGTVTACNGASGCLSNPPCYANETCHTVRKYDTHTNQLLGVYSSWGWSPSRTAVAADNSVWVGNRGCLNNLANCDSDDARHGNAAHLDPDGGLICRADVVGGAGSSDVAVRGVTIDRDGNAWLGSWQQGKIYQYSGSETQGTADGVPLCKRLKEVDLLGSRAYGAAVDSQGFLWIAALDSGQVRKIDTATGQIVLSVSVGKNTYGLAIDGNDNVWYGNWSGGDTAVIRVNGSSGAVDNFGRTQGDTSGGKTRGVAVDNVEGSIWVAEHDHHTISKFAPDGTHLGQFSVQGQGITARGPLGMAIDFDENVWAIDYDSGHASKFDRNGNLLSVFAVGGAPYTYSDMTGYMLRTVTLKHGTWTLSYDSGYDQARWDAIEWEGSMAPDDRVAVRVRSAPTEGALIGASYSPYHEADPAQPPPWRADIRGQVPDNRWLQVEVTLETDDDTSPAFRGLRVMWQY